MFKSLEKKILIILIVILLLGGFLRFKNLGYQSLWIDEGYTINASLAIQDHGYPLLDSGNVYKNQPLTSYIVAGSMKLFGFDPLSPWSTRVPAAFFGLLSILLTFIFTKRLFNNDWIALTATASIAFLPWEIAWSRQARGYTILQFFLLLSFDQFLIFIKTNKIYRFFISSITFAFAFFAHALALVFLPGFLFTLSVWLLTNMKKINWKYVLLIPIIFALGYFIAWPYLRDLVIYNFLDYYNKFFFDEFMILSVLSITGFTVALFREKKLISGTLLSSSILFSYIIITAYGPLLHYRYLVPLLPFLVITSAYGAFTPFFALNKITKEKISFVLWPLAFFLIGGFFFYSGILKYTSDSILKKGSPQPDFNKAYSYILENKETGDLIISPYAHLTKIYTGDPGMLQPISLTGKPTEASLASGSNNDFYTNAPVIKTSYDLFKITRENHGYIVIDELAGSRLGDVFGLISNHPVIREVYHSESESGENIWVYKF